MFETAHVQAAQAVLDEIGPCTLIDLALKMKEKQILPNYDTVGYVINLRKLVEGGSLNAEKILKVQALRGLTNLQQTAIKEITKEAFETDVRYSFEELAQECFNRTKEDNPKIIESKIRFLLIPLSRPGDDDEPYEECP